MKNINISTIYHKEYFNNLFFRDIFTPNTKGVLFQFTSKAIGINPSAGSVDQSSLQASASDSSQGQALPLGMVESSTKVFNFLVYFSFESFSVRSFMLIIDNPSLRKALEDLIASQKPETEDKDRMEKLPGNVFVNEINLMQTTGFLLHLFTNEQDSFIDFLLQNNYISDVEPLNTGNRIDRSGYDKHLEMISPALDLKSLRPEDAAFIEGHQGLDMNNKIHYLMFEFDKVNTRTINIEQLSQLPLFTIITRVIDSTLQEYLEKDFDFFRGKPLDIKHLAQEISIKFKTLNACIDEDLTTLI